MNSDTFATLLDENVFQRYMQLETPKDKIQVEYIWVGGSGKDLRCKTKTVELKDGNPIKSADQLPLWNFDGSSTGQAPGDDSEVYLKPVAIYPDPFRRGNNLLCLCECLSPKMEPIATNTRDAAVKIFETKEIKDEEPWYGIEQEYTLFESDGLTPLGWPRGGFPGPQGPYYCSIGTREARGRQIVEAHYRCCLYSGVNISGINAEVMAGQWEYQVGPCLGIASGDQLILSRYLLVRVAESMGVVVSFDPKPIPGDWNGAGCHTNYSTKSMRAENGYEHILKAIDRMEKKHEEHIAAYGEGNERRLTGHHETASIEKFSWGVANRGASVRVPRFTARDKRGYLEDRRPASNMDPYRVTSLLAKTTILG